MFIEKYRKQLEEAEDGKKVPQYFVQLYCKVLNRKKKYDDTLNYVKEKKDSFGMMLDYQSVVVDTLL